MAADVVAQPALGAGEPVAGGVVQAPAHVAELDRAPRAQDDRVEDPPAGVGQRLRRRADRARGGAGQHAGLDLGDRVRGGADGLRRARDH
ncbi:MAG: hypothetical protein ACXVVU_20695, partial [Solirubrobacteraceae bacterium]